MGLSYDEFNDTSPRELELLIDQQAMVTDLENYRTGLVVAATYNTLRSKNTDKVWTPSDFFTLRSLKAKPLPEPPQPKPTPEQVAANQVDILTGWYVGTKSRLKQQRKGRGK